MKTTITDPKEKTENAVPPAIEKNILNRGNSVNGLNQADTEEFATRKKLSKKATEEELNEEEAREERRANRVSDSGVRDDDDDGADALYNEMYDGA